ncbi:murein biosynthesis integral membrane protein MurJ [Jeotgalibacillus sp. S-D1]|nr:murein biosynthesis integral membrane protein MurJ [Jeotgalibacillus sp. S-D1]
MKNLGLAGLLFILATLFLKISGLIRDMVFAFYFGTSIEADAYTIAFTFTNIVILFLNTGMKNALVPTYMNALENRRGAYHLSQVMRSTAIVSLVISALGAAFAPLYIPFIYYGLDEKGTDIAVFVTIIFFSSIVAVGMNAVLEAYFDANHRFAISVVSQILVMASSITAAVFFASTIGVYSLAFGYLAGTILSLLLKMLFFVPKGTYSLRWKFDRKEIRSFYLIFIPVAVTAMIGQINLTVDHAFASPYGKGIVNYITFAKNLVHFPQAIIAVTIGTMIFPMLSKAQTSNNKKLFKMGLQRGISTMSLILFPALAGMVWLMPGIIEAIYQRGAFTKEATEATTTVAYYYIGSVLFFSLQTVLNKGFYAMNKGQVIFRIGILSILLNGICNYIFTNMMDSYMGIPLASSFVAFIYFIASYYLFTKLMDKSNQKELMMDLSKILLSVLFMLIVLWCIRPLTASLPNLVEIAAVSAAGAAAYIGAVFMLRVSAVTFLISVFIKRKSIE